MLQDDLGVVVCLVDETMRMTLAGRVLLIVLHCLGHDHLQWCRSVTNVNSSVPSRGLT